MFVQCDNDIIDIVDTRFEFSATGFVAKGHEGQPSHEKRVCVGSM